MDKSGVSKWLLANAPTLAVLLAIVVASANAGNALGHIQAQIETLNSSVGQIEDRLSDIDDHLLDMNSRLGRVEGPMGVPENNGLDNDSGRKIENP